MVKDRVLSTLGEALNSDHISQAAYRLGKWREQAEAAARPFPKGYQTLARQAYLAALPAMFTHALTSQGGHE